MFDRAFRLVSVFATVVSMAAAIAMAADWPGWRGEDRRGVWQEDEILTEFPEGGLKISWRVPIHEGYAGPAVAAGRVFVSDFVRGEGIQGAERALCLDERTGDLLWKHEWPVNYSGTQPTWASGPRATPTVDGDRVYFLGGMGRLLCLDAKSGEVIWQTDLVADHGAVVPTWGVSSPPLVEGKLLIVLAGGEEEGAVIAFHKKTGKPVWRALPDVGDPGYAAPLVVEAGGTRQLVVWHPEAVVGLDPKNGRVYWEERIESKMGMSVATPVFDDGRLLVSAFFDGAMMLDLDTRRPQAKRIWRKQGPTEQPDDTQALHSLISTPVLDGAFVYGIGSYGELRALKAESGERVWQSLDLVGEHARWAAGMIVRHGDRYFVNTDRGDLVIARFTPEGYQEIDRTALIEPTSRGGGRRELDAVLWTHPAYANRHIVVRNDKEILRASLAAKP